jgi:mRNA interferase MazF
MDRPEFDLTEHNKVKHKLETMLYMNQKDKDKIVDLEKWALKIISYDIEERMYKQAVPKKGEIWSVDLGINVGDVMNKVRPCIIVSYDEFNDNSNCTTIIPITRAEFNFKTQFVINDSKIIKVKADSEQSVSGTAKAEQIRTVSKAQLGYKIATLNEEGMVELNQALKNHLGLA